MPAVFAGIAYAYGGFIVTWTELPTLMNAATWLPGCLLGVSLIYGRSRWGAPVLGLSLAMTVLAGHFQIAAYVWMIVGLYALARLMWEGANQRATRVASVVAAFAVRPGERIACRFSGLGTVEVALSG